MSPKVVGIFSRESDETYKWLSDFIDSHSSLEARPVYISSQSSALRTHISSCKFAVLYHSKNRGRINVTNVKDSLYDEELQMLSETLGKKQVIVVIDDLQDSNEDTKQRILKEQWSIEKLALNVFLFSSDEKTPHNAGLESSSDTFAKKKREMEKIWKGERNSGEKQKNQKIRPEPDRTDSPDNRSSRVTSPTQPDDKKSGDCCSSCCTIL